MSNVKAVAVVWHPWGDVSLVFKQFLSVLLNSVYGFHKNHKQLQLKDELLCV